MGPLLFLIYINDIVNNPTSNARLFADDTSLYVLVNNPNEAAVKLNEDLLKIKAVACNVQPLQNGIIINI